MKNNNHIKKMVFSEISELRTEKCNPKTENKNFPCIELEHIEQRTGLINGYTYLNEQKSIKNIFIKGDILFGKLRPYLRKFWLAEFDGVCSSEIWVFKNKNIHNKYLFYLIQSEEFIRICNITSGSKMPRADKEVVFNYPFSIVNSYDEQEKIADCLTTWDRAIETLSALIQAKKQYKKGLMQQLLTRKKRLNGFNEEWKEVNLGEIGMIPVKDAISEIKNKKTLTVRLYAKGVDFNDNAKTIISKTGRPYFIRYENEILIGRQNIHNGGIGIVTNKHSGHICSNAITSFIVNTYNNTFFILHYLSYPFIYKKIENHMAGTGQKEISEKQLLKLNFTIPPLAEQTAIAEILSAADREISLLEKKKTLLEIQKKGLMQQLLTGKKRLF